MADMRWTYQPAAAKAANATRVAATPPQPPPAPAPVHIDTHGFVVRSLVAADVTPHFVEWVNSPAVSAGLNLPAFHFDAAGMRALIASFDGRSHYLLGMFEHGVLLGFYTLDVDPTHRLATITAALGAPGGMRRKVYWATIDAVLDHFFVYRGIEKIVARVLSRHHAMLFNFIDNGRFFFEARLRQECLGPDGKREDILVFAAFRDGPRPPGQGFQP